MKRSPYPRGVPVQYRGVALLAMIVVSGTMYVACGGADRQYGQGGKPDSGPGSGAVGPTDSGSGATGSGATGSGATGSGATGSGGGSGTGAAGSNAGGRGQGGTGQGGTGTGALPSGGSAGSGRGGSANMMMRDASDDSATSNTR